MTHAVCRGILQHMAKMTHALQFKVLIEQDEDGLYVASVPELPGCYTQGRTLEAVRKRIREAIELERIASENPSRRQPFTGRI